MYFVQLFMFKYNRNLLPSIFDDMFLRNYAVHDLTTRQQELLRTPFIKTFPFERTVRLSGVYLFNYFSSRTDMDVSYETYKRHLKRHILGSTTDIYYDVCKNLKKRFS